MAARNICERDIAMWQMFLLYTAEVLILIQAANSNTTAFQLGLYFSNIPRICKTQPVQIIQTRG